MNIIRLLMHMLGFNSVSDYVRSVIGIKAKAALLFDLVLASALTGFSFIPMFEKWVWSPFYSFVFYMIVLATELVAGIVVSKRVKGDKFNPEKLQRIVPIALAHMILLGIFFNLGRVNKDLGVPGIDEMVFNGAARVAYFVILTANVVSILRNFASLGIIKGKAAEFLIKYVSNPVDKIEGDK